MITSGLIKEVYFHKNLSHEKHSRVLGGGGLRLSPPGDILMYSGSIPL